MFSIVNAIVGMSDQSVENLLMKLFDKLFSESESFKTSFEEFYPSFIKYLAVTSCKFFDKISWISQYQTSSLEKPKNYVGSSRNNSSSTPLTSLESELQKNGFFDYDDVVVEKPSKEELNTQELF